MSDKFLKNMAHMIEDTKSLSLKVLLEEKDKKDDEDVFAAFGDKEDDDEGGSTEGGGTEGGGTEGGGTEGEGTEGDDKDEGGGDDEDEGGGGEDVYDNLNNLDSFTKTIKDRNDLLKTMLAKHEFHPEKNISASFNRMTKSKRKSNLTFKKLMLMKEESDLNKTLDKVEKSLKDEKERIEKIGDDAHNVSSKIIQGFDVNIEEKAAQALNDFVNFDKKFSKAEVVANWYMFEIGEMSSPQELENNIKNFKAQFNKLLPKESKIDIQEEPTKYNTGTGGKNPSS